jgi:hypothetical protein
VIASLLAALAAWNQILPLVLEAEQNGKAVLAEIEAVLANHGIAADTASLNKVIAEARAAKAHEDDILGAPTEGN